MGSLEYHCGIIEISLDYHCRIIVVSLEFILVSLKNIKLVGYYWISLSINGNHLLQKVFINQSILNYCLYIYHPN